MQALIPVIIALVIAGLILWAIEQFPLDDTIKKLIKVVVVVVCVIIVLYALLGVLGGGGLNLPPLRR